MRTPIVQRTAIAVLAVCAVIGVLLHDWPLVASMVISLAVQAMVVRDRRRKQ